MAGIIYPANWKMICRQDLYIAPDTHVIEMDTIGLNDTLLLALRNSFNFKDAKTRAALAFSGGLDSSVLTVLAMEENLPFTAVTIACSDTHPDFAHAMLLHQQFNFQLKALIIDPGQNPDDMYDLLFAEIAELGFGFVVCGDTIDEQLGGYAQHQFTKESRVAVFRKYWNNLMPKHLVPLHRAAHANNIEVALPYLAAARFIQTIPINHRATDSDRKIILKRLAEKLGVPTEIITRPKFGLCNVLQTERVPPQ